MAFAMGLPLLSALPERFARPDGLGVAPSVDPRAIITAAVSLQQGNAFFKAPCQSFCLSVRGDPAPSAASQLRNSLLTVRILLRP
jgi:hypothetical protein